MSEHEKNEPKEKEKSFVRSLVIPITIALVVGGTAPWWVDLIQGSEQPRRNENQPTSLDDPNALHPNESVISDDSGNIQGLGNTEPWGNGQSQLSPETYNASGIRLATYCSGDPMTAEWILVQYHQWNEGHYCYLSLAENEVGEPPRWTQWIQYKYGTQEVEPSELERKAEREPQNLFIRVPKSEKSQRTVEAEYRQVVFANIPADDKPLRVGYGKWVKVLTRQIDGSDQILTLPFGDLPSDPFQFRVKVDIDEGTSKSITVDFN